MALLLNLRSAYSQGIKIGVGFSGITQRYTNPNCFAIGYDNNVGEKLAIGLMGKIGFPPNNSNGVTVSYGFPSPNGSVRFTVGHTTNWYEFSYASTYFFKDNTDASFYASGGISLLKAKNEYEVSSLSVDNDPSLSQYGNLSEGNFEQAINMIPLSIHMGHRGEFEGSYLEYYIGVSIIPFGANPDVEPAALAEHGVETRFAPVSFQYGVFYGISWFK